MPCGNKSIIGYRKTMKTLENKEEKLFLNYGNFHGNAAKCNRERLLGMFYAESSVS